MHGPSTTCGAGGGGGGNGAGAGAEAPPPLGFEAGLVGALVGGWALPDLPLRPPNSFPILPLRPPNSFPDLPLRPPNGFGRELDLDRKPLDETDIKSAILQQNRTTRNRTKIMANSETEKCMVFIMGCKDRHYLLGTNWLSIAINPEDEQDQLPMHLTTVTVINTSNPYTFETYMKNERLAPIDFSSISNRLLPLVVADSASSFYDTKINKKRFLIVAD